jgi:hypothetical protein
MLTALLTKAWLSKRSNPLFSFQKNVSAYMITKNVSAYKIFAVCFIATMKVFIVSFCNNTVVNRCKCKRFQNQRNVSAYSASSASVVRDRDKRRPHYVSIIKQDEAGHTFSWSSRKQDNRWSIIIFCLWSRKVIDLSAKISYNIYVR